MYVSDFLTDSKKNVPTVIFFAHEEKTTNNPRSTPDNPGFYNVCYIICPYQFSDIVGLHHSFIYFQIGLHPYKASRAL